MLTRISVSDAIKPSGHFKTLNLYGTRVNPLSFLLQLIEARMKPNIKEKMINGKQNNVMTDDC
jgi:hypothetical protein